MEARLSSSWPSRGGSDPPLAGASGSEGPLDRGPECRGPGGLAPAAPGGSISAGLEVLRGREWRSRGGSSHSHVLGSGGGVPLSSLLRQGGLSV